MKGILVSWRSGRSAVWESLVVSTYGHLTGNLIKVSRASGSDGKYLVFVFEHLTLLGPDTGDVTKGVVLTHYYIGDSLGRVPKNIATNEDGSMSSNISHLSVINSSSFYGLMINSSCLNTKSNEFSHNRNDKLVLYSYEDMMTTRIKELDDLVSKALSSGNRNDVIALNKVLTQYGLKASFDKNKDIDLTNSTGIFNQVLSKDSFTSILSVLYSYEKSNVKSPADLLSEVSVYPDSVMKTHIQSIVTVCSRDLSLISRNLCITFKCSTKIVGKVIVMDHPLYTAKIDLSDKSTVLGKVQNTDIQISQKCTRSR